MMPGHSSRAKSLFSIPLVPCSAPLRNRERLAGGPGGGNERPWSTHGGGEIFGTMPTSSGLPCFLSERGLEVLPKWDANKGCGLPHLSTRIQPQQPAEHTRNRSGTPPTMTTPCHYTIRPPAGVPLRGTANGQNGWPPPPPLPCSVCLWPADAGPVAANAAPGEPVARRPR